MKKCCKCKEVDRYKTSSYCKPCGDQYEEETKKHRAFLRRKRNYEKADSTANTFRCPHCYTREVYGEEVHKLGIWNSFAHQCNECGKVTQYTRFGRALLDISVEEYDDYTEEEWDQNFDRLHLAMGRTTAGFWGEKYKEVNLRRK